MVAPSPSPSPVKTGQLDDVQELRRLQPSVVPERYLRDNDEQPAPSLVCPSLELPLIDMQHLEAEGGCDGELLRLAAACQDWGFFQVVNHGVGEGLLDAMEAVSREFFMLPLEEKEKYPMAPGTVQGYGHAFVFSEDQKLDWCNMLALGVQPAFIRNPKLWPTNPDKFSETLELYSAKVRSLCQKLLAHIARTLGIAPETFDQSFGEAVQAVRLNYYPACARPDLVLGLSPHSDGSAVTVLQQDMSCAGLQVLRGGKWVPVKPVRHALVVNVGDTLEVATNGRYKSVEHRAVTSAERDRLSIVTFYAPSYEVEVGPLAELVGRSEGARYRTYKHGEYSRHYVTSRLQGKRALQFAKLPAA